MLRFGILGTGRIGEMHAGLVALQPDACVTWCYDVDLARAEETARKVGGRSTKNADTVLGADDVDGTIQTSDR